MSPFRWSGLGGFIGLAALLTAGSMFWLEPYVKDSLESYLSRKNTATVNIGQVNIQYWPLQMELKDIQFADPRNIKQNSLQIERINFQLSVDGLLLKKLIVDDMSVDRVQLNRPRQLPAKIISVEKDQAAEKEKQEQDKSLSISDIDLPDVNEVLKKEPLESTRIFEQLQQDIDKTKGNWEKIRGDIGDKQRWNAYEQRYAVIKQKFKGNTKQKIQALKESKQLINELKKELGKIQQARQQFNEDYERLGNELKQARQAPSKDIQRIRKKYKLDNLNAENITQILLGDKAASYVVQARYWYKKLQPYLESAEEDEEPVHERSRGRYIEFAEYNPQPDVYIRHIAITASLPRGDFIGEIKHLSSDQSINRQPMTFVISGNKMVGRDSEKISGEVNLLDPANRFVRLDYEIQAARLKDVVLSRSNKLPLAIKTALMDMKLNARLANGQVKGKSLMDFRQLQFSSEPGAKASSMALMMSRSFKKVNAFRVKADFVGALDRLQLKLQSDLDNKVGAELKAQLKQKGREFEQTLQARIKEKFSQPLAKFEQEHQRLQQIKTDLDKKEQQIRQRIEDLKQKIKQKEAEKKQQLKNKLKTKKDKLKQKLLDKLKR